MKISLSSGETRSPGLHRLVTTTRYLVDHTIVHLLGVNEMLVGATKSSSECRCAQVGKHRDIFKRTTDDERLGGRQNSLSGAQLIIKAAAGQSNFHARRYASFASEQLAATDFKVRASSDTVREARKKHAEVTVRY